MLASAVVQGTGDTAAGVSDDELVPRLRDGDESAFAALVRRHHRSLARFARSFVPSEAVAEEVAQETWLAVIRGLDGFEGRSSLRTWIFRILLNTARSRGVSEQRSLPFSSLGPDDLEPCAAVDSSRFRPKDDAFAGYWINAPVQWWAAPEARALAGETRDLVAMALRDLPVAQAQVVTLRDIEGWSAREVCEVLGLSEGNQRVLLHRGRSRLRAVLEAHFEEAVTA